MAKKKTNLKLITLAALVAAGGYLYLNFSSLLTRTVEKIATDAVGVSVDIGSINISLSDKKVTVSSIKVANPSGYSNPHVMTTDALMIGLNTASEKLIDFSNIQVKGSSIFFEMNEKGTNVQDLKKRTEGKEQKESVGSEQIRVIVQQMMIDASTVNATLFGKEVPAITIPALKFSGIGSGKGIEAGDAIKQIFTKYMASAEKAVRESGLLQGLPIPGEVGDAIKNVEDIKNNIGGGSAEDAAKNLQNMLR